MIIRKVSWLVALVVATTLSGCAGGQPAPVCGRPLNMRLPEEPEQAAEQQTAAAKLSHETLGMEVHDPIDQSLPKEEVERRDEM